MPILALLPTLCIMGKLGQAANGCVIMNDKKHASNNSRPELSQLEPDVHVAWYPGTSQFSHIVVDLGTGGKQQGSKMQLGSPGTCISASFIDKQHL